jgi:collagen type III alpha
MASGTATPDKPPVKPQTTQPERIEGYIQQRIGQTRRHLKGVDLALALMTLATGILAYLLAAAVFDQWLLRGGLGFWSRLLLWMGLLGAGGYYFARQVLPPLVRRINPIYAAETIEKSRPSLKNSLINFLLLRGHREEMPQVVYQALQQRAAADLTQVHADTAVDRARVIRLGYVLAGTLALFCLYLVLSPKSLVASASRVLWPWLGVAAPTRVTIDDVAPGNAEKYLGEFANVSAKVKGLREGEPVTLLYSTADGQSVNQAIPMSSEGLNRYSATLPPSSLGLQQDYEYHLAAGDCTTPAFKIEVLIPPAITVDSIDYHYPQYTGIADRSVARQGDIRALEGTEVTIHATANQEIKEARIDFGAESLPMSARGMKAVGRFTLRLSKDDPLRPEHDSYQLRFTATSGKPNRWPSRHGIEVLADQKPEVELLVPRQQEVQLVQDGQLEIRVRAKDPDFALRQVALQAKQGLQNLPIPPFLSKPYPLEPLTSEFQGVYIFEPAKLALKVGDRIQYWAEAVDNKEPEAGRSATQRQWIEIVGNTPPQQAPGNQQAAGAQQPKGKGNPSDQRTSELPNRDSDQQQNPSKKQDENPPAKKQPPQKPDESKEQGQDSESRQSEDAKDQANRAGDGSGKSKSSSGDEGEKTSSEKTEQQRSEPVDPANEGEAIKAINEHRDEEKQKEKTDQPQEPGKKSDQQQGASTQNKKQESGKPDQQQSTAKPDAKQESGKNTDQQQSTARIGAKQDANQKSDQQQAGAGKTDQQQSAPKPEAKQDTGKKSSQQQQENGKSGQQPDSSKSGQQPGTAKPETKQESGNKSDQQPGSGKSGRQGGAGKTDQQQGGAKTDQQPTSAKPDTKQDVGKTSDQQPTSAKPDAKSDAGKTSDQRQETGKPDQKQGGTKKSDQQPGEETPGEKQDAKNPDQKKPDKPPEQNQAAGQPNQDQSPAGSAGNPSSKDESSPEAVGNNQPRQKKPNDEPSVSPKKSAEPQSASSSPKQSDSKTKGIEGDRSGSGNQGGGEQANQGGEGSAGANSQAEQGGSTSQQRGGGEAGKRPGEEIQAKDKTGGNSTVRREGDGSSTGEPEASDRIGKTPLPKDAASPGKGSQPDKPTGGTPGNEVADQEGAQGQGNPRTGGAPGKQPENPSPTNASPGGEEPNLEFARKQTELALEHLKDQMAKEKPDLLDRLGWTQDEAKRFLDKWEQMMRDAQQNNTRGKAAKNDLEEALKSLGLRPQSTELRGGQTGRDQSGGLREAGRFSPSAEWADQIRAYQKGVAEGGK